MDHLAFKQCELDVVELHWMRVERKIDCASLPEKNEIISHDSETRHKWIDEIDSCWVIVVNCGLKGKTPFSVQCFDAFIHCMADKLERHRDDRNVHCMRCSFKCSSPKLVRNVPSRRVWWCPVRMVNDPNNFCDLQVVYNDKKSTNKLSGNMVHMEHVW